MRFRAARVLNADFVAPETPELRSSAFRDTPAQVAPEGAEFKDLRDSLWQDVQRLYGQVERLSTQVKDLQRSKTMLEENIATLADEQCAGARG